MDYVRFNIFPVIKNVIGIINNTENTGARDRSILNHSMNVNKKIVDAIMLTLCESGNVRNFIQVGFTRYVKYTFKKNDPIKLTT